jgi:hypothetical protein
MGLMARLRSEGGRGSLCSLSMPLRQRLSMNTQINRKGLTRLRPFMGTLNLTINLSRIVVIQWLQVTILRGGIHTSTSIQVDLLHTVVTKGTPTHLTGVPLTSPI